MTAGWSSPVARQAHNLKVVGSNPTPATNLSRPAYKNRTRFFVQELRLVGSRRRLQKSRTRCQSGRLDEKSPAFFVCYGRRMHPIGGRVFHEFTVFAENFRATVS